MEIPLFCSGADLGSVSMRTCEQNLPEVLSYGTVKAKITLGTNIVGVSPDAEAFNEGAGIINDLSGVHDLDDGRSFNS